jgi:hypothetical protein
MAKVGSYGWSPEQMARINARRSAAGQEKLVNLNNPITEEDFNSIVRNASKRAEAKTTSPSTEEDEDENLSMKKESEDRTKKFREKFKPAGSMATEYGVKSRMPSVIKGGVKGGVGVMQDSLNRLSGAV